VEKSIALMRKLLSGDVKVVIYRGPYTAAPLQDDIILKASVKFKEVSNARFKTTCNVVADVLITSTVRNSRIKFVSECGKVICEYMGHKLDTNATQFCAGNEFTIHNISVELDGPLQGVEDYTDPIPVERPKDEEIYQTIIRKMREGILEETNQVDRAARVAELHEFLLTMDLEKPCKKSIWERYCKSYLTNK